MLPFETPPDPACRDLLLASARPLNDLNAKSAILSLLDSDLDTSDLIAQAGQHRLLPLMYAHLQSVGSERVPQELMTQLRERFHGQALNNFQLTQTLLRLLRLFDQHGISAIPWKGPVLAVMAYGGIQLRPFTDLDLIVPESQIDLAKTLLCQYGYRLLRPLTTAQEARHRRIFHAYTLLPEEGIGSIDLHWRLTQYYFPLPIDMDRLWDRLETVQVEGVPVRTLPPEELLLFLCVHGTVHRWAELGWLSDIASLMSRSPLLNWEFILRQSRSLNSERMVLLGLSLCRDLLGSQLPKEVLERRACTPLVAKLSERVQSRLWVEPVTTWQRFISYGVVAPTLSRVRDRALFWWRTAQWVMRDYLKRKVQVILWRMKTRAISTR